jgi:hypothetical protein
MKENEVPQPGDPTFMSRIAFLTDKMQHLNDICVKLQATKRVITLRYDSVNAFKCESSMWAKYPTDENPTHF